MTGFLAISSGQLTAAISPYGAALARLWVYNHPTSLVLGLPAPRDYAAAPHAIGVVVGPVAGRVSGARVEIGGQCWTMHANTPPDCLHSGADGVQNLLWDVTALKPDELRLEIRLPHGHAGLPGNRHITVDYRVEGTQLQLEITSTSDRDTPLNLASHAYWVLDDSGSLSDHRLMVPSHHMCELGPNLIPTGRILETTRQTHDFRQPRGPLDGPPLDGCYCLTNDIPAFGKLHPALYLYSERSKIGLRVATSEPGVVLYTAENMPKIAAQPNCPTIAPFSAMAIEAQGWPDAPNQARFPSILRKAGQQTRQITTYSIELPKS